MSKSRPKFLGLFHDDQVTDSYWIRDCGVVALPPLLGVQRLIVHGELLPPGTDTTSNGPLGITIRHRGRVIADINPLPIGPFQFEVPVASSDNGPSTLSFALRGVGFSNFLAWLGRVTGLATLQPWRRQSRNRRVRIRRIEADGETLFDFSNRASPWNVAFARRHLQLGMNIAGFFRADLGIGESARCMARAAEADRIPLALVDLRLPCKNSLGDDSFQEKLQSTTPHVVTVVHVDPPGMRDLTHHHGEEFLRNKYTIGYWAWELPDFPDAWIHFGDYCQEVWAPSRFAADAIGAKLPLPVHVMPHAISFTRPVGNFRAKYGLPQDKFLFLFLYDLNSYSARKNPAAALAAFRASGLAGHGAALVVKVHNVAGNETDFAQLEKETRSLDGTVLITKTLSRQEVYELESACDCFVSLHRAEGFGFAVAECMYLGKPVISTDWSATAEFVNEDNGYPVRYTLTTLERNHGPYAKGQAWAEADVAHAAEQMRSVFQDRARAGRIGNAARATIEERFSPAAIGARYRRRLEAIASW